ncbi:MAG: DUF881 domain-containing protein [Nocardioidaceae bacterium]|nr:DUF881 domain-containing protein [Nocardioidaceae bacterium]
MLAGALFATTGLSAKGLDLRAASITDLDHVVRSERARSDDLQRQVADLNKQVASLSRQVSDRQVEQLQDEVDRLRDPAGFSPVAGPGLTVTLNDAPKSEIKKAAEPGGLNEDELLVHQQDIQAVVNALWAGGAEAMTLQGQRVISTTGIKCVGSTVVLHGVPYSPPYRISAIGDPVSLRAALDASDYVNEYVALAISNQLGYDVQEEGRLRFPAYTARARLKYAEAGVVTEPSRSN